MPTGPNTIPKIIGQDVSIVASKVATGAIALTNWTEFDVEFSMKTYDVTAAAAKGEQKRGGRKSFKGSVKGLVGGTETLPNLPQVGDILLSLSAQTTVEGANLMGDLSDAATYGRVAVTKINYKQGDAAGNYGFDFESGY